MRYSLCLTSCFVLFSILTHAEVRGPKILNRLPIRQEFSNATTSTPSYTGPATETNLPATNNGTDHGDYTTAEPDSYSTSAENMPGTSTLLSPSVPETTSGIQSNPLATGATYSAAGSDATMDTPSATSTAINDGDGPTYEQPTTNPGGNFSSYLPTSSYNTNPETTLPESSPTSTSDNPTFGADPDISTTTGLRYQPSGSVPTSVYANSSSSDGDPAYIGTGTESSMTMSASLSETTYSETLSLSYGTDAPAATPNVTIPLSTNTTVSSDMSSTELYTSSTAEPTASNSTEPLTTSTSTSLTTDPDSDMPVISSTIMPSVVNQTTWHTVSETGAPTYIPSTVNSSSTYMPVYPTSSVPSLSPITVYPNSTTSESKTSTSSSTTTQDYSDSTTTAPSVVLPTATNSHSTFIPSSIIAQTSSTLSPDETSTTSMETGIPTALPKIVQNPLSSSTPVQPDDTTEVQIGFQWALNYPFVVSHPLSTSQIFTYLPIGISEGLGLKSNQIVVKNLLPLDTTTELNFITTVARIFIPTSMVDTLRVDLGIPVSPIYQNQDESVSTLMNYINPAIPFFPGAIMDPGPYPSATDSHAKPTPSDDNGLFNSASQQAQSPSAKGTTAGIALAAFGGAAAYGAAMFLLARRYKRRKLQRTRIESFSNSDMRDFRSPDSAPDIGPSAVMSGGRSSPTHDRHSRGSGRTGNTARTALISAPMTSENSLGWN